MSQNSAGNPLGQHTVYRDQYAPELLFAIARAQNRELLGIHGNTLPFKGQDIWHAYELSWLEGNGKPAVALLELVVPCDTPFLIESKSLKLYLNSFNQTHFENAQKVTDVIVRDLSQALGKPVQVAMHNTRAQFAAFDLQIPAGECLDELDVNTHIYSPSADLLQIAEQVVVTETLYSDLFKSNCPVTGQPDWGTVVVNYRGQRIERKSLLRYLISYRQHQGFHEHCAEQIFCDLLARCAPQSLTLSLHFLRRGGLDINPVRSTEPLKYPVSLPRLLRQ